jgi:hypothetical protein
VEEVAVVLAAEDLVALPQAAVMVEAEEAVEAVVFMAVVPQVEDSMAGALPAGAVDSCLAAALEAVALALDLWPVPEWERGHSAGATLARDRAAQAWQQETLELAPAQEASETGVTA